MKRSRSIRSGKVSSRLLLLLVVVAIIFAVVMIVPPNGGRRRMTAPTPPAQQVEQGAALPEPSRGDEPLPGAASAAGVPGGDGSNGADAETRTPPAGEPPARIRVGAWNIEWLGNPGSRSGGAKGVVQDPKQLAEHIADSGVALLALQEIVTKERGSPIRSREIEAVIDALTASSGAGWKYVLFPGRQRGDQLTGVMWDSRRVTALDEHGGPLDPLAQPWPAPIAEGRASTGGVIWARPPHAMKFRAGSADSGRTDFVVISVHMKADYKGDFASHRLEEARALLAALPAVEEHFGDQDVLVLGDSNAASDTEGTVVALVEAGFRELNTADRPTHYRGEAMMDRTLVPADQPEFASARFEVASERFMSERKLSAEDFKRLYSDHYLVVCEFEVMGDDD